MRYRSTKSTGQTRTETRGGFTLIEVIVAMFILMVGILGLAGEIKKAVDIPVIAVGGILKLDQAEQALRDGLADMVAIARALIADPEMVTKSLEGKADDVVECTGCFQCFMPGSPHLTCAVNEDI